MSSLAAKPRICLDVPENSGCLAVFAGTLHNHCMDRRGWMRFRRCSLLCIAGMATATFSAASTAPPARPPDRESEPAPQATADIASSYAIHWHAIAAGTARMRNSCFRLAATIGQPAPGYSTNANFIVAAGFWAGAPTSGQDDLFFSGFERCTP